MEIRYKDRKQEKDFQNRKNLTKKYGSKIAGKLMMRINTIRYAKQIEDIPHTPPEKRHSLSGNYENCFAVALTENYRLVFRVVENENAETIAEIQGVIDYH
jgi:proteic killer suppression protein